MEQVAQVAPPFGSVTAPFMATSATTAGVFGPWRLSPVRPLALHPASHGLHYGSACFEGLKAHRGVDGVVRLFRAADHVTRLRRSAEALCLPVPDPELALDMIHGTVAANMDHVPPAPGALYIRPALLGVDTNIGAAAAPSTEALLFVIASPVGDYYHASKPLTLHLETQLPRTTPQFGRVKSGANYAMALGVTMRARTELGADQVLFAPSGDVQETGTSNLVLLDDDRVVTKALDTSILHGVTRGSVLTLARYLGYAVEERDIPIDELVAWAQRGEITLVGTAAVMSSVGTLLHDGQRITVGSSTPARNTQRLRTELLAVQRGTAPDHWGWTAALTSGAGTD
jgi:branched-chain amino acid aminotransferase